MNLVELQKKLTAAARLQPPDERVPYAFEKRVMAHIKGRAGVDRWAVWSRGLWRAAISCLAIAMILGAVTWFMLPASDKLNDLTQDFENTLLASADYSSTMP